MIEKSGIGPRAGSRSDPIRPSRLRWLRTGDPSLSVLLILALLGSACSGGNGETANAPGPTPGPGQAADPDSVRPADPGSDHAADPGSVQPPDSPSDGTTGPLRISTMGYNRGSSDAPVKVLEISDFGCGYCRRFHQEIFPAITKAYIDEGLVEWKFIPFVLGKFPNGLEAALAAECAGEQGAFFPMQARLFAEQRGWRDSDTPYQYLSRLAGEEGLDVPRFDTCIADGRRENRLRANIRLGQQAGARGTPYFLVDGRPIPGVMPLEDFREVLDLALVQRGREPPSR